MTLHAIVAALGGDLYCGGVRASVPAPGHSAADRSVSLLLIGDRLVIHSFGSTSWAAVRDHLRSLGHIDEHGRLTASGGAPTGRRSDPRPDGRVRMDAARRLWAGGRPIKAADLSGRYLRLRAIASDPSGMLGLRHHGCAPLAVYRPEGHGCPALVAAITAPGGEVTAVEVTYLAPNGHRHARLRTPRKMAGRIPAGAAVRLAPGAPAMVVGEGVMSVLSASEHLELPAWALLSAHNLAAWSPPAGTRSVTIAADRGAAGETAAARLLSRLRAGDVQARVAPPPGGFEDWNAWAVDRSRREGR